MRRRRLLLLIYLLILLRLPPGLGLDAGRMSKGRTVRTIFAEIYDGVIVFVVFMGAFHVCASEVFGDCESNEEDRAFV